MFERSSLTQIEDYADFGAPVSPEVTSRSQNTVYSSETDEQLAILAADVLVGAVRNAEKAAIVGANTIAAGGIMLGIGGYWLGTYAYDRLKPLVTNGMSRITESLVSTPTDRVSDFDTRITTDTQVELRGWGRWDGPTWRTMGRGLHNLSERLSDKTTEFLFRKFDSIDPRSDS